MSRDRRKFAVIAEETWRASDGKAQATPEYRLSVIETWIGQHEDDDDLEHAEQRKNIARIDNSITWWLGAAAASGTILGIVGTVLMAIFVWALGLVRFGGG